jgi:hypothetical protein
MKVLLAPEEFVSVHKYNSGSVDEPLSPFRLSDTKEYGVRVLPVPLSPSVHLNFPKALVQSYLDDLVENILRKLLTWKLAELWVNVRTGRS